MGSVSTDRRLGVVGSVAFKAPCDCATTANITLSGEQTIDGVTTSTSRVLVKNQTTASANGIYDTSSGTWTRAIDANGNYDWRNGSLVLVAGGAQAGQIYECTAANPITVGTTSLTFALSLTASASTLSFLSALSGAVSRTMTAKERDWPSVADLGIVADGVTDQTSALLTMAAANPSNYFYIPPNVLYNQATLLATLPATVSFLDLSRINDFTSAGETSKRMGMISADSATNDSTWSITSGHHPTLTTNNFGSSGTTSATQRKGSWLWAAGNFALGGLTNRGYRGAAIQQFTKDSSGSFWTWVVRSLAPWAAINGQYEAWATGQVISGAGVYRTNATNHYVSTGAGTTGVTAPTHTTGSVSDGGVTWTYLDSTDRGVFSVDEYGRFLIGTGAAGSTFFHKVSPTDPNGSYNFYAASRGTSQPALLKLVPTNAGATESAQPFLRAEDALGLRFMKSDGTTSMGSVTDSGWALDLVATQGAAPTLTSGATIAPVKRINFVSGTAAIGTITAPAPIASTGGQITLIPTGVFTWTNAGNIAIAGTAVVSKALIMTYDTTTTKWYPSYLS